MGKIPEKYKILFNLLCNYYDLFPYFSKIRSEIKNLKKIANSYKIRRPQNKPLPVSGFSGDQENVSFHRGATT